MAFPADFLPTEQGNLVAEHLIFPADQEFSEYRE